MKKKKEILQDKFSTRTWNKIEKYIPDEFIDYEIFKCWQDYKGAGKKIDLNYLENHYKKLYGEDTKIKLLYTHCQGASSRFIRRHNFYILIVY